MQFLRGSRDYCQGVQVQVHLPENSSDNVVFCFLVLSLFYSFTEGVQWLFQRKLLFLKVSEGVQLFQGGRAIFSMEGGGVQWVISIETHITCDFPGGGGADPISPLWIRTCDFTTYFLISKGNISCGFPKDPSQEDDSFEHQNKCLDL